MLEQAGINLKGLNVDKLKAEYQELMKQKNEHKRLFEKDGQARKSAGRMPWHWEPMKDVISCDKLRGAANKH